MAIAERSATQGVPAHRHQREMRAQAWHACPAHRRQSPRLLTTSQFSRNRTFDLAAAHLPSRVANGTKPPFAAAQLFCWLGGIFDQISVSYHDYTDR